MTPRITGLCKGGHHAQCTGTLHRLSGGGPCACPCHTPSVDSQDRHQEVPDFPRFCANDCGRVLERREQAVRVKFTRNLDGVSWFDWVCKRDCEPQRTYADANGFCPFDAGGNQ